MSDKKVKLTVILPCYNVEKYLPTALDSVINQTLKDIEIIPVDDGSPDNCAEIIKAYSKKDNRIKPIFKENGGYGSAVNAGIKAAYGKYIAILEPDDYVMESYYELMYREAIDDELDVCGVNSYCEIRDMAQPKLVQTHWVDNPDYLSYEAINEYLSGGCAGITLKIYRRKFLLEHNITLANDLRAYHDVPFVAEALISARRSRIVIGTGYYYRKDNITSTTKSKSNFVGMVDAVRKVECILNKNNIRESRKAALVGYCARHLLTYYYLARARLKNKAVSEFIKNEIAKILAHSSYVTIHAGSVESIKSLFPECRDIRAIQSNVITFDKCPSFDIEYFKKEVSLSTALSKLYFFTCFTGTLKKDNIYEDYRERLSNALCIIPGLSSKPITDFIKSYLEYCVFDFIKYFNEKWYITFFLYLAEHEDSSYFSFISDSINNARSDTTNARYFPDVVAHYSPEFASLDNLFRKNMVIRQASDLNAHNFLNFLKEKTIALVGNSPCEVGKKKGDEIDSHDIVIRYNNYSCSAEFQEDYGSKANIWAITPGIESLNFREEMYEYEFVLSPKLSNKLQGVRLDILYDYIISGGSFFQIDSIECRRFSDIIIPSIGLYTLFFICKHLDSFGKVSLYGFAPKTAKQENRHYFQGDKVPTSAVRFHNWDKEQEYLEYFSNLISEHNAKL